MMYFMRGGLHGLYAEGDREDEGEVAGRIPGLGVPTASDLLGTAWRILKRTLIGMTLIGIIPWAYWWMKNICALVTGRISPDANGIPLR